MRFYIGFVCFLLFLPLCVQAANPSVNQPSLYELRQLVDQENDKQGITTFSEALTARKISIFALQPTWGSTELRDIVETGNGGSATDTQGIIRLATGTNSSGTFSLQSVEMIEYQPGGSAEVGIGLLGDSVASMTGGQFVEWGAFSSRNGYGFGADTQGLYVFFKRKSKKTKVYQSNWNRDRLDGTKSRAHNESGISFDLEDGAVYQIVYTWYGFGDVEFYINAADTENQNRQRVLVHKFNFDGQTSVIEPNLPITIKGNNNGATQNVQVDIGGRQGSMITGTKDNIQRPVNEFISDFTLNGSEDGWEPLMAIRKKSPFPSGTQRENSVRVQFQGLETEVEDGPVQFKVTLSDTTSATFSNVTDWADESGVESTTNSDNFTADQGIPFLRTFIPAGTQGSSSGKSDQVRRRILIPRGQNIVVWGRKESASDATVSVVLRWDEQW